jgi:hypothetical protein
LVALPISKETSYTLIFLTGAGYVGGDFPATRVLARTPLILRNGEFDRNGESVLAKFRRTKSAIAYG